MSSASISEAHRKEVGAEDQIAEGDASRNVSCEAGQPRANTRATEDARRSGAPSAVDAGDLCVTPPSPPRVVEMRAARDSEADRESRAEIGGLLREAFELRPLRVDEGPPLTRSSGV
jgi:hypothetical protein